jgi:hypothetical protein
MQPVPPPESVLNQGWAHERIHVRRIDRDRVPGADAADPMLLSRPAIREQHPMRLSGHVDPGPELEQVLLQLGRGIGQLGTV